jgi:hypothetical protein
MSEFKKIKRDFVQAGDVTSDFVRGMEFYRMVLYDALELVKATKLIEAQAWEEWVNANLPALYEKAKMELEGKKPASKPVGDIVSRLFDRFIEAIIRKLEERGELDKIIDAIKNVASSSANTSTEENV